MFYMEKFNAFLNQARASLWPARAWFLEIAFVREIGACVCLSVCLSVSAPRALITTHVK